MQFQKIWIKIIALIEPQVLVQIHGKTEKLENPYGERILPERGEQIVYKFLRERKMKFKTLAT